MEKKQVNSLWKPFCLAFAALFVLSLVFCGLLCRSEKPGLPVAELPAETEETGGATIGESTGRGLSLLSAKIAPQDYEANGISPMAETAYTLTATVTPSHAMNKEVDWSVAFVDPESAWAMGKTASDYVTVTPESDGALTATVECLQAVVLSDSDKGHGGFDSSVNPMIYIAPSGTDLLDAHTLTVTPVYGVGTLEDEFETVVSVSTDSRFISEAAEVGLTIPLYSAEINKNWDMGKSFCASVFGSENMNDVSKLSQLCDFIRSSVTTPLLQLTVEMTGEYSNFEKTFPLYCSVGYLYTAVESVSLDHPAFVF